MELRDEQAAVGEDQHADRARRLDEAGRGDRLARGGRMAEPVAPDRAGIVLRRVLLVELVVDDSPGRSSSSSSSRPRRRARGLRARCRSSSALRRAALSAISSVSIPVSASTWWRRSVVPDASCGSGVREHALEPEHQPETDLPAGRGRAAARVELGDRLVECASARRAGRQHFVRVLALAEERLAGPRRRPRSVCGKPIRRQGRPIGDFRMCAARPIRAATSEKGCALAVSLKASVAFLEA